MGEHQKPGPILSNGKRLKIKDMTKKKKKARVDSKNSGGEIKRSKGDMTNSKRKDRKLKKKQNDADGIKELQKDINYVFADDKHLKK